MVEALIVSISTSLTGTDALSAMASCIAFLNAGDCESRFETPITSCSTLIAATNFTVGDWIGILPAAVGLKVDTDNVGARDGDSKDELRIDPELKSEIVGSAIDEPPEKITVVIAKPRPSMTEDDPYVIETCAKMVPVKVLECPIDALVPTAQNTFIA